MKFLGLLVVGVCLAAAVSGQTGNIISQAGNVGIENSASWQIPSQQLASGMDPLGLTGSVNTMGSPLNNAINSVGNQFNSGLNTVSNQFNSGLNTVSNQFNPGLNTFSSQSLNPLHPGVTTTSFGTSPGINPLNSMAPTFSQGTFNTAPFLPASPTMNTFSTVPASTTYVGGNVDQYALPLTTQFTNPPSSFSFDAGMSMAPTFMSPVTTMTPPMSSSMIYTSPTMLNTFQAAPTVNFQSPMFEFGNSQYFNDPFSMNMYMPSTNTGSMDPTFSFNQGIMGTNGNGPIGGEQVFCIPPSKIPPGMRAVLMSLK